MHSDMMGQQPLEIMHPDIMRLRRRIKRLQSDHDDHGGEHMEKNFAQYQKEEYEAYHGESERKRLEEETR